MAKKGSFGVVFEAFSRSRLRWKFDQPTAVVSSRFGG